MASHSLALVQKKKRVLALQRVLDMGSSGHACSETAGVTAAASGKDRAPGGRVGRGVQWVLEVPQRMF